MVVGLELSIFFSVLFIETCVTDQFNNISAVASQEGIKLFIFYSQYIRTSVDINENTNKMGL